MLTRYYRELLNFLTGKVADRATAADLAQESYARVLAAESGGSKAADTRALLYQTARNLVIDHYRHQGVRASVGMAGGDAQQPAEVDAQLGPAGLEPEAALASKQGVAALVAAIGALPPRCREAFLLHRFEGLSYAQIAAQMGISVKMVEQHLKNALDACERSRRAHEGLPPEPAGPGAKKAPRTRSRHG